ncbi:MAG: hypothetical protein R3D27_12940 [Hyphomicrobiaceae bacterium]
MTTVPENAGQDCGSAAALADGVVRLRECRLSVADRQWTFQRDNVDAIERHFRAAVRRTPEFYNGRVFVLTEVRIEDGRLDGVLLPTDFASYLYWRESGFDPSLGRDVFGKAIIEAADGALLFGRAADYTMNAGRADLVGGFIDPIDVGFDGAVDIDASIARELGEETGLELASLERRPGYVMAVEGALVALCVHLRSPLSSDELSARIGATLAAQGKPEIAEVVAILPRLHADRGALAGLGVPDYAIRLLAALSAEVD